MVLLLVIFRWAVYFLVTVNVLTSHVVMTLVVVLIVDHSILLTKFRVKVGHLIVNMKVDGSFSVLTIQVPVGRKLVRGGVFGYRSKWRKVCPRPVLRSATSTCSIIPTVLVIFQVVIGLFLTKRTRFMF